MLSHVSIPFHKALALCETMDGNLTATVCLPISIETPKFLISSVARFFDIYQQANYQTTTERCHLEAVKFVTVNPHSNGSVNIVADIGRRLTEVT